MKVESAKKNGAAHSEPAIENAVLDRYRKGAQQKAESLCCPVSYEARFFQVIPDEILEKDYGCGDPSRFVKSGDTVLDLGSGGGKIAYIAAQLVGAQGHVIGVDFNPAMLALARKYKQQIAASIGFDVVDFRRGKIQDLSLDLDLLDRELALHPVRSADDFQWLSETCERLRRAQPLIPSESVDIVLSNCVLNLVNDADKRQLLSEIFRVAKVGGRIAISDIVSDEPAPEELKRDSELWSGCISGAFEEEAFLRAFEDAGFHGIELAKRDEKPWRVVNGIEFRAVTVTAYKGKQGPCFERNQAVIYKGPFKQVMDDDGHVLKRGVREAVCDKTFKLYSREPYASHFYHVEPNNEVPLSDAMPFDCKRSKRRDPRETKGREYTLTTEESSCCGPDGCE